MELANGGYKYIISLVSGATRVPMMGAAMPNGVLAMRITSEESAAELERFLGRYAERYGDSFVPAPRLLAFADYLVLRALAMTSVGSDDPQQVSAAMKELAAPPGERWGHSISTPPRRRCVRAATSISTGSRGHSIDARGEVADGFVQEYGVTTSGDVVALPRT